MIKPEVMNILNGKSNESLIELLYTTPVRVAEWFRKHNVNVPIDECEKLMLHN